MNTLSQASFVFCLFATVACNGNDDPPRTPSARQAMIDRVTECGGGMSTSTTAALRARIADDLMSGDLSASLKNDIQAQITADPLIPSADKLEIYKIFEACLEKIRNGR